MNSVGHDPDAPLRSDGERELVECHEELAAAGRFGSDVLVAAAEVLHEGMTGGKDPRCAVTSGLTSAAAGPSAARGQTRPGCSPSVQMCAEPRGLLIKDPRIGSAATEWPRWPRVTSPK